MRNFGLVGGEFRPLKIIATYGLADSNKDLALPSEATRRSDTVGGDSCSVT